MSPNRVRFFLVGEYGNHCRHGIDLDRVGCPLCKLGRPHYHAILFNCAFPDLEPYSERDGEVRYTSPMLEKLWGFGFVDVGELTFESAAYVARYSLKKINGVLADDHYQALTLDGEVVYLHPEFARMSRRPGIGADWFAEFHGDVFPSDEVPVVGRGVIKGVPRYYEKLYARLDELALEEVKAVRQVYRAEHADEFRPERLYAKYRVKQAQIEQLKREL